MQFGITQETKGNNLTPFDPGIQPAALIKVVYEKTTPKEEGGTSYTTLAFYFTGRGEAKGRDYKHVEWALKPDDAKMEKKMNALNVRIKHIFEAYAPTPAEGLGVGATNFEEYFEKIAKQFNTLNNGNPIFVTMEGEGEAKKAKMIPIWIIQCYDNRNALGFPYSPNFIEKDKGKLDPATNKPKSDLVLDVRFHKLKQVEAAPGGGANPALDLTSSANDLDDFIPPVQTGGDEPKF